MTFMQTHPESFNSFLKNVKKEILSYRKRFGNAQLDKDILQKNW